MIASAKLDVTANTFAEEVEAELVSVVAARRGVTCASLVLKRLVFRSLMEFVRFTRERTLEVHAVLDRWVLQRLLSSTGHPHLHRQGLELLPGICCGHNSEV